ncbi:MAG: dihydroorotase [Actinomycetota bacterium]|nr:dihydroorotase [Actinomycetota bacterium]
MEGKQLVVCPGFIDMHVHLRDPGDEMEEDISSGIKAALAGGFTAIACMPNTRPPIDNPYLIDYIKDKAKIHGFNLLPVAAMTKGLKGKQLTEMGLLAEQGAVAFSDDGYCVQDSRNMYEIMRYSRQINSLLILHEEDNHFSEEGLVHEGYYSNKFGLEGISPLGEELIIARDIMLAEKTGARIHITHLSSAKSVELIREAKKNGINISCDVTPHHLYFNHTCLDKLDTNLKVKPPIRDERDQKALIEGIKDGTIDAVASDHAPHLLEEKNTTLRDAAFGAIGMETSFKASFSKLCIQEKMNFVDFLKLFTLGPAKILEISCPTVKEKQLANLVVLDIKSKNKVMPEFISKSSNCPFIGQNLTGQVLYTINNGKLCYKRE